MYFRFSWQTCWKGRLGFFSFFHSWPGDDDQMRPDRLFVHLVHFSGSEVLGFLCHALRILYAGCSKDAKGEERPEEGLQYVGYLYLGVRRVSRICNW